MQIDIDYKQHFVKLCLQIESLKNTKKNSFNYDEIQNTKNKIKQQYKQIDNLLDDYLNERN